MTSAYPTPVDTLETKVRNWAVELGAMPSRNKVMKRFGVGAPKASAVLNALKASGFTPDTTREVPVVRLHSVPTDTLTTADPMPAVIPDANPVPPVTPEPAVPDVVERPDAGGDASALEASVTDQAGRNLDVQETSPEGRNPAGREASPTLDPAPGDGSAPRDKRHARAARWPVLLLALPAFVAVWGGWVGLGELTGFGPVNLLPGIGGGWTINSAITLPIGVEAYAAYALGVWLSGAVRSEKALRFARWSAIGSLVLGALGQVAYHLMEAAGVTSAPWWITTFVSVLPVVVLGCGAALTHLMHADRTEDRR